MREFAALDWSEILQKMSDAATSTGGKDRILRLEPLGSPDEALKSFYNIQSASQLINMGLRPFMESLDLFAPWNARLKKNAVLKTLEIKDVRLFCLEGLALREALNRADNLWSQEVSNTLMDPAEPLSAIDQILTPQGDIRSDASERLYGLYTEKEKLAREVQHQLDRLVKDHQMENLLQDKYVTTREGRWVLPIRSGMQHHMPGVIHGSSQTKQTVFMEPEKVVPINNRLRQIEVDIEDEIERLLTELSHYLATRNPEFEQARKIMEECDVIFAQAQMCLRLKTSPCEFSEDIIELIELRHPLLQLSGKEVISNTVTLTAEKSILLLSGPNAGGKTVLLKSIGLAAQMARCGLPICATEGSRLPFFRNLLIGIGDAQSVDAELSTFAAHMNLLNRATDLKGKDSMILIDEICGSTDPEEGSALARSFIESFAHQGVFATITSHLGPLKSGWQPQDPVLNGSMEYSRGSGRPTYHFIAGLPGDSLALQTAKRVGVKNEIVERATELLSPTTRERLQKLEQIEQMRSDVMMLQDQLRKENNKAQQLKRKYEEKLQEFDKEKNAWLEKTVPKHEKKVDEEIQKVKAADTFDKHRQLQEIKFQLPEIVKAKGIDRGLAAENAEEFAKRFPPGSKVFVPTLNQDGIVQSTPNSKGEVTILSNSIRLHLLWQELKPPGKAQNPTSQLVRESSGFSVSLANEDLSLDVRGKTVEEAVEELELALDRAAQRQEDRIKVIHGHGTEALKKAVRAYLSRSIYVKKWKAGSPENGGDGITWVELDNSR
jgi:DNA mismatch repair protein MutS2